MTRQELETALAAVIEAESATGFRWWPGLEMAAVAVRRWASYVRRKSTSGTREERTADLARGLREHYEPETPYIHPAEWERLARRLADVLQHTREMP